MRTTLLLGALISACAAPVVKPATTSEFTLHFDEQVQIERKRLLATGNCANVSSGSCDGRYFVTQSNGFVGWTRWYDASGRHTGTRSFSCMGDETVGIVGSCFSDALISACSLAKRGLDVVAVTVDGQKAGSRFESDMMTGEVTFSSNPFEPVQLTVSEIEPNTALSVENFGTLEAGSVFALPAQLVLNGSGVYATLDYRKHYAVHEGPPWESETR